MTCMLGSVPASLCVGVCEERRQACSQHLATLCGLPGTLVAVQQRVPAPSPACVPPTVLRHLGRPTVQSRAPPACASGFFGTRRGIPAKREKCIGKNVAFTAHRRRHEPPDEACRCDRAHVGSNDEVPAAQKGADRDGGRGGWGGGGLGGWGGAPGHLMSLAGQEHALAHGALFAPASSSSSPAPVLLSTHTLPPPHPCSPPDEQPAVHNPLAGPPRPPAHDVGVWPVEANGGGGQAICHQVHPQQLRGGREQGWRHVKLVGSCCKVGVSGVSGEYSVSVSQMLLRPPGIKQAWSALAALTPKHKASASRGGPCLHRVQALWDAQERGAEDGHHLACKKQKKKYDTLG